MERTLRVGGVKCQPFLKESNHWKVALKIFFMGTSASSFLKLSLLKRRKKAYDIRNALTTSSRCFIKVVTAA